LNNLKYFSHDDSVRLDIKDHFKNLTVIDEDYNGFHDEPRSVDIHIEKSDVNYPEIEESYNAKGYNYDEALFNARNTTYIFAQQDSVLKFDYTLRKRPGTPWRDESIDITLRLPLNAKVMIDQKLDNYVRDINLYDCNEQDKRQGYEPAVFTMTNNGLQCKIDTLVTVKKDTAVKVKTDTTKADQ